MNLNEEEAKQFESDIKLFTDGLAKSIVNVIESNSEHLKRKYGVAEIKLIIATALARGAGATGMEVMSADDFLKMIVAQCNVPAVTVVQAAAEIVGTCVPDEVKELIKSGEHNCETCSADGCRNRKSQGLAN